MCRVATATVTAHKRQAVSKPHRPAAAAAAKKATASAAAASAGHRTKVLKQMKHAVQVNRLRNLSSHITHKYAVTEYAGICGANAWVMQASSAQAHKTVEKETTPKLLVTKLVS